MLYHKQGVPYQDLGAEAQVFSPDHTYVHVHVTTVSNGVPSPCDTLGKYVVQYEAVGPHGLHVIRAERTVQIGRFSCILNVCFKLECVVTSEETVLLFV